MRPNKEAEIFGMFSLLSTMNHVQTQHQLSACKERLGLKKGFVKGNPTLSSFPK